MEVAFYLSASVAVFATIMVITEVHAVHALLYLIVSLLSVAVIFFVVGAPFVAALEVIIYAGAIMVLFVFFIMMLNVGEWAITQESLWLSSRWGQVAAIVLTAVLFVELLYVFSLGASHPVTESVVEPRQVGIALFGPYLLGVELVSMLLLAGLIGAYHLGRREGEQGPGGGGRQ